MQGKLQFQEREVLSENLICPHDKTCGDWLLFDGVWGIWLVLSFSKILWEVAFSHVTTLTSKSPNGWVGYAKKERSQDRSNFSERIELFMYFHNTSSALATDPQSSDLSSQPVEDENILSALWSLCGHQALSPSLYSLLNPSFYFVPMFSRL